MSIEKFSILGTILDMQRLYQLFSINPKKTIDKLIWFVYHKPKMNEKQKKYMREYYREYRKQNPAWDAYKKEYNFNRYWQAKLLVMTHYGKKCVTCGEEKLQKLSIDHINNDGGDHRRKLNMKCGGYNFYLWLIKNDFPSGFQTLCISCNCRKNINWMRQNGLLKKETS